MYGSMADIQSATAEIIGKEKKKEEEEDRRKTTGQKIYGLPYIAYCGHKNVALRYNAW